MTIPSMDEISPSMDDISSSIDGNSMHIFNQEFENMMHRIYLQNPNK